MNGVQGPVWFSRLLWWCGYRIINTIQDDKATMLPYPKWVCLFITQATSVYGAWQQDLQAQPSSV